MPENGELKSPAVSSSDPLLGSGQFFGRMVSRAGADGLTLVESRYVPRSALPRHRHEHANFCFILAGGFDEVSGSRRRRACERNTLLFREPQELHRQWFGAAGAHCFSVELAGRWLDRWHEDLRPCGGADDLGAPARTAALRLYGELAVIDDVSPLAIEGLMLELLACVSRFRDAGSASAPRWLGNTVDYLRAEFRRTMRVRDVAAVASVHPVHLARTFRRALGCGVADYVRHLRVVEACRMLTSSDVPVGRVALDLGFSDHSHFTRSFRLAMGCSPAAYRRLKAKTSTMLHSF
jgi:AraC family transcriptional regulator